MDVDPTKNGLNKANFSLFTLEYPPDRGGIARYLFELGRALSSIQVVRADQFLWRLWPKWLPFVTQLRREHRARGLLISHVLPAGTAALLARFLGGPSYGVFFHGMDLLQARRSSWKKWLTTQIIKYSHALFVNSQTTATILKHFTGRVPSIVTPGIEPRAFLPKEEARQRLGIALGEKVVLSVGRLVARKGFDVLIEAMKNVDARLVIVGDGPDHERLKKMLHATCTLLPSLTDKDRDLWYAAADVFVLPVREESNDIEGFGIVFLEAALAGLPVIAGRSGGVAEAVEEGKTAILVDPRNAVEVRRAIQDLLNDPNRARTMGQTGRVRAVKDFQWSERAKLVEQAFPLLSVIIPVYQRVHLLERALASLAAQTYRYFEVVIVDDGSTENVEPIIKKWQNQLPIRFERFAQNQGAPVARNRGFALSNGEFVIFLDHDASLRRDALEVFLRTLQEHPESDVAYSSHRFGWKLFRGHPFDPTTLKQGNYIHTSSLIRRSVFRGFDLTLKKFQDWDLWLTMIERGSNMIWINKILFSLKADGTMSGWLPSIVYRLPWGRIGWMPNQLKKYREAERVIRLKHGLKP